MADWPTQIEAGEAMNDASKAPLAAGVGDGVGVGVGGGVGVGVGVEV